MVSNGRMSPSVHTVSSNGRGSRTVITSLEIAKTAEGSMFPNKARTDAAQSANAKS